MHVPNTIALHVIGPPRVPDPSAPDPSPERKRRVPWLAPIPSPAPHSRWGLGHALLVALATACLVSGCAQSRQFQPSVDAESLTDTQFIHYLSTIPVVDVSEACRAMIIVADGEDAFDNFEDRYTELRRRGIVRDAWGVQPKHVLDLGTLAFMAGKICRLPPSVSSILLGSWGPGDRRYAVKQAAAGEIINYAPPYKPVTGGEMLLALARVDEYMASKGIYDFGGEDINAPENAPAANK